MKNIFSLFLGLLITGGVFAQKTINDPNAEVRDVKGFHGIKVSTGIELVLTQGNAEAVAISAPDAEDRERIKTVVENGVLKIYYDYNFWKLLNGKITKKLKAYVSIIKVDYMAVASGARLKIDGEVNSDKLTIKANSGGMLEGKIKATSVNADQSSGAVVNLAGSAETLDVDGSSGAVFQGYDLAVNSCNAGTSSGAVAQLNVSKEISAEASSGGHVSFRGDATIRSKRTSSGGHVGRKE